MKETVNDLVGLILLITIVSFGSIMASCGSPDASWDNRVRAYEIHHERREGMHKGRSNAEILRDRGTVEREIPATVKLIESIEHAGE